MVCRRGVGDSPVRQRSQITPELERTANGNPKRQCKMDR
jgi:hypothetical protein